MAYKLFLLGCFAGYIALGCCLFVYVEVGSVLFKALGVILVGAGLVLVVLIAIETHRYDRYYQDNNQ